MSKKAISMIVVAVILIAIIVGIVTVKLSKSDEGSTENKEIAENAEVNLKTLNEKLSGISPFNEMATMDVDNMVITDVYQIEESLVKDFIGKMPMMNVHASMYLVIEATEGNVEAVREKVEAYANSYEAQWEMYLPEQYDLVKDRKLGVNGNFVYLFIGENVEEMEALMK